MYVWFVLVIASTAMSPFLIFFFRLLSPVVFSITERTFDANSSVAAISSNSQLFSISRILYQVSAADFPGFLFKMKKSAMPWCLFRSGKKCNLIIAESRYKGKEFLPFLLPYLSSPGALIVYLPK